MKRILLCLLAAVCLLSGCVSGGSSATTNQTTTFPVNRTPLEILTEAVEKTENASSFVLTYELEEEDGIYAEQFYAELTKDGRGGYQAVTGMPCGCGRYVNGSTAVHIDCESGEVTRQTAESPYGLVYVFQELPALPEGLLQRFCNMSLTASPSNTGITRFQISGLDHGQMAALLGVSDPGEGAADYDGYFVLELDSAGYLVGVEYTDATQAGTVHRISITRLNQKMEIEKPQWA